MFPVDRSALAVLLPLALLAAAALWSNHSDDSRVASSAAPAPQEQPDPRERPDQTVAANLPSR